jgi:hypothetical protein
MTTRHQLHAQITSTYAALGVTTPMRLEQPAGIASPQYRVTVEALGLTFVSVVPAARAQNFELRIVAQLRAIVGRTRVVAALLDAPQRTVEAAVAEAMIAGVDADRALDQLALAWR